MKSPLHPPLCGGLFRCCRQQLRGGSRVAAAFPRASRRPGGRRSARRRTIPRRRSAAPSWVGAAPLWGAASLRTPALRSLRRWCWPVAAASWAAAFFFSRGRGSGSGRKKEREHFPCAKFRGKKKKSALLIYPIRCRPRGKSTYNRNKKASNCVKSQIPRPRHPSRVPPTAGAATA